MISSAGLAAFLIVGCTSGGTGTSVEAQKALTPKFASVSPAPGSRNVNGANQVMVTYSHPLPAGAGLPTLTPAIPGTWQRKGDEAIFTPRTGFAQRTRVTVTIPVIGAAGTRVRTTRTTAKIVTFTTGSYSTLRLQQLLAQLGYLPLAWSASAESRPVNVTRPRQQLSAAYNPPAGSFSWNSHGYPSTLYSFWSQGTPNTLTRGAVTGFEGDHGMTTDGNASPAVWSALLKAAASDQVDTDGYSYALVSQNADPETLTIWHNGKQAFRSVTNTGIPVSPTPIGTFPVYERLPFQIMSGTNPDGSSYADPVEWVSYFSGGAAVHYFDRYTYGWPQSLGCVELPLAAAKQAYPLLPYGTLVTVLAE
ncbi:MAG: ErfK/YbiS/YcfS/YnhG family protein [Actinomycetia bacterium]|nr:ErfK/YbiS/YcfS/YnhG family protein [Actinomycetes bacterium]